MDKRILFTSIGITSAMALCAQQNVQRPNVILLLADDLGYGDISCYGATRVTTPHVDSLANAGVRFTDAHAVASTSTPSRWSILTGEYCYRRQGNDIAAGNAGMIIRPDCYTLADMFHSGGYKTAAIGKWHLGLGSQTGKQNWNSKLDMGPWDIGFDYSYIMAATADRVPCVFIEDGNVANWDESAPIEVSYWKNFAGEPTGASNPELLYNLKPSHGHDQSIVNGISRIGFMKGGGKALWKDENLADSIVAHAIGFMQQNVGNPFFMYLCTNDIHVPRFPNERFRGKSAMGLRGEAIMQFDWTVGQITAALKRLGLADNTIIILTSDNGPVLDDGYKDEAVALAGSHKPGGPFRGGKYSSFEAGTAVPFIVSGTNLVASGKVSDALISHLDDVASLARLIGVTVPKGAAPDSKDYLSTWLGKSDKSRDIVVEMAVNRSVSLRMGQWKYIRPSKGGPIAGPTGIETGFGTTPQLYNLNTSLYEQTNVYGQYPKMVKKFEKIAKSLGLE